MARTKITNITQQLQQDDGNVLFSLVQGEQLEFPVTLTFLENASLYFEYEAVIIEASDDVDPANGLPVGAKPGGVMDKLEVYFRPFRDTWSPTEVYQRDDLVLWSDNYFRLRTGYNFTSALTPGEDLYHWENVLPNIVYIRFPASLSTNWSSQPTVSTNVYGMFELEVKEPVGGRFQRIWKPLRGAVEFLYSPTRVVP